ncbi:hypothetical protein EG68_10228 [Paragonimus skrjabini miyazakii]|uniref:EF-hand domain-containing protein n=1 Tax=Paragonimus skrjabini miyazakii TaxID=59628 RepID=A0A8S9Y9G2_9TREM|nr:hypothetical protein EG68_10228 [Paragonimus skrjabini miyazakii]
MEDFLNVFFKIDTDYDETITMQDLETFAKKNQLDPLITKRWTTLFDKERAGKITLRRFCEVLGLKPEEALSKRRGTIADFSELFKLGTDVTVHASDMQMGQQINISNETRSLLKKEPELSATDLAKNLKIFLDSEYGRAWNVVVTDGSFWMNFTHDVQASFQFGLRKKNFLVWRTTEDPNVEHR